MTVIIKNIKIFKLENIEKKYNSNQIYNHKVWSVIEYLLWPSNYYVYNILNKKILIEIFC